jgi:hypothetical protein
MSHKEIRRVYGAIFMTVAVVCFSIPSHTFSYFFLLYMSLLWGAASLGYGADTTGQKIVRRLLQGLAFACTALPIAIPTQQWWLLIMHFVICVGSAPLLGVPSKIPARAEEIFLGTAFVFCVIFMV